MYVVNDSAGLYNIDSGRASWRFVEDIGMVSKVATQCDGATRYQSGLRGEVAVC